MGSKESTSSASNERLPAIVPGQPQQRRPTGTHPTQPARQRTQRHTLSGSPLRARTRCSRRTGSHSLSVASAQAVLDRFWGEKSGSRRSACPTRACGAGGNGCSAGEEAVGCRATLPSSERRPGAGWHACVACHARCARCARCAGLQEGQVGALVQRGVGPDHVGDGLGGEGVHHAHAVPPGCMGRRAGGRGGGWLAGGWGGSHEQVLAPRAGGQALQRSWVAPLPLQRSRTAAGWRQAAGGRCLALHKQLRAVHAQLGKGPQEVGDVLGAAAGEGYRKIRRGCAEGGEGWWGGCGVAGRACGWGAWECLLGSWPPGHTVPAPPPAPASERTTPCCGSWQGPHLNSGMRWMAARAKSCSRSSPGCTEMLA